MGRRVTTGTVGSTGLGTLAITGSTLAGAANTDIILDPVGTGVLKIAGDQQLNAQGDLRFADADSSNWVGFQAPATVATNVTWTLPAADGNNGQVLTSNGSGTLSWTDKTVTITDDTSTNATRYILFTASTSGAASAVNTSSTKMTYNPSSGLFTVTAITESSSIALKENILPINDALENILKLVGVTYDRKDGSSYNEVGLIAEDVDKIIPNLVKKNEYGQPESIYYTKLTAYLIESIKSLKAEIDNLKGI